MAVERLEDRRVLSTYYVDDAFVWDTSVPDYDTDVIGVIDDGDTVIFADGEAGQQGGLIYGTEAFGTIQSAIDAASAGDTVNVAAGTYSENVVIPSGKDNLQILGNSNTDTFVQAGSGTAFKALAPVTVQGFDISGAGRGSGTAIMVGDHTGSASGTPADPGVFQDNAVHDVNYGMKTGDWNIQYWEFKNNHFDLLRIGVGLENMSHVLVTGNTFKDYKEGVSAGWDNDTAHHVTITNNGFLGSHHQGGDELAAIVLSSATHDYTMSGNLITDSIVGILVKDKDNANVPDLSNVTVRCNSIVGNTSGIINEDADVMLAAENNWWGHPTGPYHPDSNRRGQGDSVSDNVDYSPWIRAAAWLRRSDKANEKAKGPPWWTAHDALFFQWGSDE